jgi:phosphoserine phosphatase
MELLHTPLIKRSGDRPMAVFDCDGTIIRGDIGEAMFFRQIEQFHFRVSPAEVWTDHPRSRELHGLYTLLSSLPPAQRATHEEFVLFADMLTSWYYDQLAEEKTAKACSDIVRLLAGYEEDEVRDLARLTFDEEITSDATERTIGTKSYAKGVRFIRETVDLIHALQDRGVDLWVVSGSNKWSVEAVVQQVGIPPGRVIGIELENIRDTLTSRAKPPIPVKEDKVRALKARDKRLPVLVASDSPLDIPLLKYSSAVRVFVNSYRGDPEKFFRAASTRRDDSWVVIELPTEVKAWSHF